MNAMTAKEIIAAHKLKTIKVNDAETLFEKLLEIGRCFDGPLGRSCSRKLVRRYSDRLQRKFDRAISDIPRNSLCIDLGANVGKVSERLLNEGMRVVAFEPDPANFQILMNNVGHREGFIAHQAAAGVRNQTVMMERSVDWTASNLTGSESSSIAPTAGITNLENAVEVPEVDFAQFLKDLGERVGLIKVDIEGSEWELIPHLQSANVFDRFDYMFVETHEFLDTSKEALAAEFRALARRTKEPVLCFEWT